MKVITLRSQIRDVAHRWKKQYEYYSGTDPSKKMEIGQQLYDLDPEIATAEDVRGIGGNNGWARPTDCGECGFADSHVAIFEDEYNTRFELCESCLRRALDRLSAVNSELGVSPC